MRKIILKLTAPAFDTCARPITPTVNCGMGMVLVVLKGAGSDAARLLDWLGEQAFAIGTLETSNEMAPGVIIE
jgi:phosphoribosylaminoimidazole (AIR) synthetase